MRLRTVLLVLASALAWGAAARAEGPALTVSLGGVQRSYSAAELLAGKHRARINAATMAGQSKTSHQAEIDSACELIDLRQKRIELGCQRGADVHIGGLVCLADQGLRRLHQFRDGGKAVVGGLDAERRVPSGQR